MRFHAIKKPHLDEIHLSLWEPSSAGRIAVVKSITMETIDAGSSFEDAAIRLQYEDAQILMDELYAIGIRPTDGRSTVGQVQAMQNHLDDLRRLVFKEKKQDEPETKASW